jgi:hypothetical protein
MTAAPPGAPLNIDASTVVNINKVFQAHQQNLFVFWGFQRNSLRRHGGLCYILNHARMDARTHETTLEAWAEHIRVHWKDRAGDTCQPTRSLAAQLP